MHHRPPPQEKAPRGQRLLLLLLPLPFVLLLLLVGLQLCFEYRAAREKAECEVTNIAALLSSKIEAELNRAKALLSHMTENIRPELLLPHSQREHEDEVRGMLTPLLLDYPTVQDCWYFDLNGDLLYSTIAKVPPFNVSDRSYFQQLLHKPSERMFYSEVMFGRSTNKSSVYLSGALHDANARFAGVALVRLDLESVRRMFREVNLGTDGVMMLRRTEDGAQILRLPEAGETPNTRLPTKSQLRLAIEQGQDRGTMEEVSPIDGRTRMYAFQRVRSCPFFVGVGISRADYLAAWWRHTAFAGLLVLVSGTGFVLAHLRLRQFEQERSQATVREREARTRHRAILDNLDIGIFHVKDRRFTYANHCLERLSGYGEGGLLGLETRHLYPTEEVHSRLGEDLYSQVHAKGRASAEIQVVRKDGTLVWVEVGMGPVPGSQDELVGSVVDVSARREAIARLKASGVSTAETNRRHTVLLGQLATGLKGPLQDFTTLLKDLIDAQEESQRRSLLPRLRNAARALLMNSSEALDYAKLEDGSLDLKPTACSLRSLLSELVDPARERLNARQLGFHLSIDEALPELLQADPLRLRQILWTLLSNAMRFTKEGGIRLELSCGTPQGSLLPLTFTVRDTGCGIDSERATQLLGIASDGRHQTSPGLGLSLTIAERLATLMGGSLTFSSTAGQGTQFILKLSLRLD